MKVEDRTLKRVNPFYNLYIACTIPKKVPKYVQFGDNRMSSRTPLADVLRRYMRDKGWSFERLAEESGVPRNTIYRWINGEVSKPQKWQDVARVADALELNKPQTNNLLQAVQHPSIEKLLDRMQEKDRELLSRWVGFTPNNLPSQLTRFIGREEDLVRVIELISSARLITLTGAGGSGKTRLALQAAEAVLDDFTDGVFFVGLAPIRDSALVMPTIGQVLGVRESVDTPLIETLKVQLRGRHMLLLLDNFEQVVDAAPLLVDLLMAAPQVKALVTSRMRLHVSGEHEWPVLPLITPNPSSPFEALRANPAVILFAERVRAVHPSFVLTMENASTVAEICARLDGLPLAIELAAARARRVAVHKMLEWFPSRLDLARDGPRDASQRHQTLRSMIAWSYDLLRPEEQRLFRCLAVFVGGCTEEAAESVCNVNGGSKIDVSAGLDALVENNLLRDTAGADDERRFEMLETIREYALERLEASGELETTLRTHADYYLRLAETAELKFEGPAQVYWLNRTELEHDNFRAALRWCKERGDVVKGLRLSTALRPLWWLRDHHVEGRSWLETFMAGDREVPPGVLAKALLWQGLFSMRYAGDLAAAVPLRPSVRPVPRKRRSAWGVRNTSGALRCCLEPGRNLHGASPKHGKPSHSPGDRRRLPDRPRIHRTSPVRAGGWGLRGGAAPLGANAGMGPESG
jgi:predicted ATPase